MRRPLARRTVQVEDEDDVVQEDKLWAHVSSYLELEGLELDDLEIKGSSGSRRVLLLVDGPEGVGVDRLADVSRGLARFFDDNIEGTYLLEVSSPGLERSLRRPAHFEKSRGRHVKVKARTEDGPVEVSEGVLSAVDDDAITVTTEQGDVVIALADITSARTVFDMAATMRKIS